MQIGRSEPNINASTASELGPMVQGQFVVRNSGPSLIPTVQLDISWPSMADSGENFIIYPSMIMGDSDDVSNHLFNNKQRIKINQLQLHKLEPKTLMPKSNISHSNFGCINSRFYQYFEYQTIDAVANAGK